MKTLRTTTVLAAVGLALCLPVSAPAAADGNQNAATFNPARQPPALATLCHRRDCVDVRGHFRGEFFDKLEVNDSSQARTFRVDGQPARFFPPVVQLEIKFVARAANAPADPTASPQATGVPLTHDTLMRLRFKAEWRRAGKLRSVSGLSWENDYRKAETGAPAEWRYALIFAAASVPLTDTLVITLFADGGERIASLEASLP